MKLSELFPHSFKSLIRVLGLDKKRPVDSRPMWAKRLSSKSSFCRAVVATGLLTHRQMVHAALRYRLGRSKDDAVIFWQIDRLGVEHDGKLIWYGPDCHRLKHRNACWVWYLIKAHYQIPQDTFSSTHIFFGEHLLRKGGETVAIVEAEKTAVILSEHYPQYTWLAAGGLFEVQPYKFIPLTRYKVILFPDTDPDAFAYTKWYEAAQTVMRSFFWPPNNPIRVSPILERHATKDQKRRKIDLADYLFEQPNPATFQPK